MNATHSICIVQGLYHEPFDAMTAIAREASVAGPVASTGHVPTTRTAGLTSLDRRERRAQPLRLDSGLVGLSGGVRS